MLQAWVNSLHQKRSVFHSCAELNKSLLVSKWRKFFSPILSLMIFSL